MNADLLVVPHVTETPTLSITEEGTRAKDHLLSDAQPITAITDVKIRDKAISIASNIRAHLKLVEASRVDVKKPFLEVTRQIDETAAKHIHELNNELRRINRLVGLFEEERERRAREDAEALRKQQEELAAVVMQPDDELGLSEEERGERLRTRLDAEDKLEATTEQIAAVSAASGAGKAKGGALRRDWDIEVTDIKALYAAHPQCVELTAKNLAIKDLLKAGIEPAGVRARPKVDFSARSKPPALKNK